MLGASPLDADTYDPAIWMIGIPVMGSSRCYSGGVVGGNHVPKGAGGMIAPQDFSSKPLTNLTSPYVEHGFGLLHIGDEAQLFYGGLRGLWPRAVHAVFQKHCVVVQAMGVPHGRIDTLVGGAPCYYDGGDLLGSENHV